LLFVLALGCVLLLRFTFRTTEIIGSHHIP
jgi:hypothetical protein